MSNSNFNLPNIPNEKIAIEQRILAQQKIIISGFNLSNFAVKPASIAALAVGMAVNKPAGWSEPDKPTGVGVTPLGTAVWTNLAIDSDEYTDPVTQQKITVPGMNMLSVLITLSHNKNIVTTDIQGGNGTIKEYVATKDVMINIKGGFFGYNGVRPSEQIQNLKDIWMANISLAVKSPIFDEWEITNMVMQSVNVPENIGGYSYQLFDINAISDNDIILDLSNL